MTMQELLSLKQSGADIFMGMAPPSPPGRVFGGHVLAQAVRAAQATVGRTIHSLHAYFLRPGEPSQPLTYEVRRLRDGGSFSSRLVIARQGGEDLFTMMASFQENEAGFEHAARMPETPLPHELPTVGEIAEQYGKATPQYLKDYLDRDRPIEFKAVDPGRFLPALRVAGRTSGDVWFRCRDALGPDQRLHQAALAYISDASLLDVALMRHGASVFDPSIRAASLDHAIWFHAPVQADEWFLYTQESPRAASGRGLARGLIFSMGGVLVASVMQEGLLRSARSTRHHSG
jgi:acyl-CoA thioesterase-2